MRKLISDPKQVGIDAADIAACPGAIVDIHEDVLRELMQTPHALQRRTGAVGATADESGSFHARRRVCV